jgi:hypothetical protein
MADKIQELFYMMKMDLVNYTLRLEEKVARLHKILIENEICHKCGEDMFETCECTDEE